MALILAVAMGCGTALLITRWSWQALSRRWDADRVRRRDTDTDRWLVERRRVAIEERLTALKEREFDRGHKPPDDPVVIPADLEARITAWGTRIDDGEDPFAQDNERQTILSLYAQLQDWDKVRHSLAPIPVEPPVPAYMGVTA